MNKNKESQTRKTEIAKAVREACARAAQKGFQDAAMSGLCAEGAMEAAIGAIQSLDLKKVLKQIDE